MNTKSIVFAMAFTVTAVAAKAQESKKEAAPAASNTSTVQAASADCCKNNWVCYSQQRHFSKT